MLPQLEPLLSGMERLPIAGVNSKEVLVIGSIAYDDIITPYDRIDNVLGGAAAFGAMAASYFTQTRIVGIVGNDFTASDRAILERRGIDLSGVEVDNDRISFHWKGKYHEDFNSRETLEINMNAFEGYYPTLPEATTEMEYAMLGNIAPALQLHVLKQFKKSTFTIADTIDLWIETKRAELAELIQHISLFLINDREATLLTGEANLIRAGESMLAMGVPMTIIKKGEHGAYLFHPEGVFALPSYPVTELRDPTGAGDTFAGGMLGYLAAVNKRDFASIKKAMAYGTIVASLTVEDFFCKRLEQMGAVEMSNWCR